ncbi:hypothetical protein P7K49_008934, partial [Saguinus oedipus]
HNISSIPSTSPSATETWLLHEMLHHDDVHRDTELELVLQWAEQLTTERSSDGSRKMLTWKPAIRIQCGSLPVKKQNNLVVKTPVNPVTGVVVLVRTLCCEVRVPNTPRN